jgi:predicted ATPase
VNLFEALSETGAHGRLDAAASGGLTPFVGRDDEMGVLRSKWTEAKAGRGPVLLLGGEAGIGKSRHVRVLKERLDGEPFLSVECFSSQYFQSTALHPIIEMLERRMGFSREVSLEERFVRLETEVVRAGLPAANAIPLLASLLSLPLADGYPPLDLTPQRQRQATFDVLVTWLMEATRRQPVLLVVEDLHWADPSTLEFLGLAMKREPPGPLLMLLVHRPEFKVPWENQRLTQLNLGRLSAAGSERILAGITRNRPLPPEVTKHVLARADGVPLFVEEITKAVLESGALRESDRSFELVASSTALMIPSTVQDSLTARLDRLGATKATAQIAATIGRTFSFEILAAVSGMPETALRGELDRLIEAGLVFRRGDAADGTYIFKHALIQDAAYESLLRSTRQRYHQQIARTLTDRFPEMASAQPELLAQHYSGAGLVREAIDQWALAGDRAIARSAFVEAISVFTKALDQLPTLQESEERDRSEIGLRAGLGLALISTRGFSSKEVEETYARARELCQKFGDIPLGILYGVWCYQIVRGDREQTARLAEILRRIVDTSVDPSSTLIAHACLTVRTFWMGDYTQARQHALRGSTLVDGWDDPRGQATRMLREHSYEGPLYPHMHLAWCDLYVGRLQECRDGLEKGLALAEAINQPYVTAMAYSFASAICRDLREPEASVRFAQKTIDLSVENGFPFWLAGGLFVAGWGACQLGDLEGGVQRIREGLGLYKTMGVLVSVPYYTSYLGEACLKLGRIDEGLAAVDGALELSRTNAGCGFIPELLRLRGELLKDRNPAEAESCFRQALAMAGDQGAVLWGTRAAVSLGHFLREKNRDTEARTLLNEICNALPEGFAIPDVRDAWRLLAELI